MKLHYIAAGLLIVSLVHHAVSGDATRLLLRQLHKEPVEKAQNRFHNAVLAILLMYVLCIGVVILLTVPGTPELIELSVGLLISAGTVAASLYRQAVYIRSLLTVAAGSLFLAENLT